MGVDLNLMIFDNLKRSFPDWTLKLDADPELFSDIENNLDSVRILDEIGMYSDDGLYWTLEDSYGTELMMIDSRVLATKMMQHDLSPVNNAIRLFLEVMPEKKVVLYWK